MLAVDSLQDLQKPFTQKLLWVKKNTLSEGNRHFPVDEYAAHQNQQPERSAVFRYKIVIEFSPRLSGKSMFLRLMC
jgi:hypothetical protein